ncbi:hypothetical protein B4U80_02049 [Leptotrombidium deliense]|uniref:SCP domain-containing protein n=1 Tax=Leptotrombidium deliense TaxID=299467 RepID=A0A443SHA1_9ACAR|nr:hypothetical protein B4U80_02049 [Leptotrombidium deliense]
MNNLLFLIAFNIVIVAVSGNWLQSCLDRHNLYRRRHGKPLMTLDSKAISHASKRARELSSRCAFDHSGNSGSGFGENLAGGNADCARDVDMWYGEIKQYNPRNPRFSPSTGHYTQLIWRSSTRLGCATASHCRYRHVTVCSYYPPGNYAGRFNENV